MHELSEVVDVKTKVVIEMKKVVEMGGRSEGGSGRGEG